MTRRIIEGFLIFDDCTLEGYLTCTKNKYNVISSEPTDMLRLCKSNRISIT